MKSAHGCPWVILLLVAAALGCATTGPPGAALGAHAERASAAPDYDVLVGSLAALEGHPEQARDAFTRAVEKDGESAYLHRVLSRLSAHLEDLDQAIEHGWRALSLDPDDLQARILLGRIYRMRRDVAGAERALLDAAGDPVDPDASELLLHVYLEGNRLGDALRVARDLVASYPDRLSAHMSLASVYERMGQTSDAERALRVALEAYPDRFVLYSRLARLYRAAGNREQEVRVYREVLERHPAHYGTLVSLAETLLALERVDEAIETYAILVDRYPRDVQSVRRLASLEFRVGRPERAVQQLTRALERNPDQSELAYALGQAWAGVGDAAEARAAFDSVPESDELYVNARLQIVAILEAGGDFEAALSELERARAMKPDRELDFHAAALHWRAGDLPGGVALLEGLLAANPGDDEVLYQLGVLYGMASQREIALRHMRAALAQNPDNAQVLNYIGYSYADRGENLDEAEEMILRALELRPDDGYITDSLGWVYYKQARPLLGSGSFENAMELLERARQKLNRAAQLTGGDPVVSEHLGDVHVLLDQRRQALEFYEQAAELDPRPSEQPDLMHKLEDLRRELGAQ